MMRLDPLFRERAGGSIRTCRCARGSKCIEGTSCTLFQLVFLLGVRFADAGCPDHGCDDEEDRTRILWWLAVWLSRR